MAAFLGDTLIFQIVVLPYRYRRRAVWDRHDEIYRDTMSTATAIWRGFFLSSVSVVL